MTLEEAIKHCEEVAKENDDSAKEFYRVSKLETHPDREYAEGVYVECKKCANENRQLAEWLKELKERREKDLQSTCNQLATDTIIRQAAPDALEKCYTCKHVYQSVNGADTLFYRCRRGCKYEEFKPKRSTGNSQ